MRSAHGPRLEGSSMELHDARLDDLPEYLQQLMVDLGGALGRVLADESLSAAATEEELTELLRTAGREALGRGLSARYGRQQGPRRGCGCGGQQRFEGYRSIGVMTVLGAVRYERAYYRCAHCGGTHYQGDAEMGLAEGRFSLPAQEAVALVCSEMPFESGVEMLGRLTGIEVSNSQAQRITERHGQELERRAEVEREGLLGGELQLLPEGRAERLYVAADGLKMAFTDDWHETKIGAVYDVRAGADGIDEPHRVSYVCGAREGPEAFGGRLYQEAAHRGVEQAQEQVVIGDGAPWIWNLMAEHFPRAVQILDFYHATERLHEVGRAVYGEGTDRARAWAEANTERLWTGRLSGVLRSLRALRPASAGGREAVRLAIGYYQDNRGRMDYPGYRARGYHVGSGVVEAACKTVVAARCKRSGMRWSKDGAQSVLALRSQRLNRRWDSYWQPLKAAC